MRTQHKSSSPYPEWNNKKFEAKLEKEIEQRKNLASVSANYILPNQEKGSTYQIGDPNGEMLVESTGIYKQFLLIGVPPSVENSHDPNVKPTVLIAYPPFEYPNMPIKKIIEHSMPTGHTREFLSANPLSPIQDEFVFQFGGGLGSESKPIYGVCIHVSTKDTSLPFFGHKTDKDRVFCFCLMTKMPAFSVHFSFLTSLVLWTIGHVRHLHKYENKIRVNIPPGEPIDDLDLEDQIGHHPSVEVPVSFQNEIASYFISNISSKPEKLSRASSTFMQGYVTRKLEKMNNRRHNFRYDVEDCSIELKFPPVQDISANCISWASLDTLFSLISVPDILTIISGLLLDRQVLIIGSRLEEVSMSVWALQSILRPFKFAGTVIPILPTTSEDYIGLLQLPTPFLFGVPRCNELKAIKFLETAVFVDLDKRNVPPVEDLPNYPNENVVKTKLTKFLYSFKNKKELNEYSLPAIYKKTLNHKYSFSPNSCQKINEIIGSPFQNSIYSNYICGFFVSAEGVTVFNEELFLGQIYSLITTQPEELYGETTPYPSREKEKEKKINEEIDFWTDIVESQTFQMYIEERMQSFMDLKNRGISNDDFKESNEDSNDKNNEDDVQKKASSSKAAASKLAPENYDSKESSSDVDDNIKDIDKQKNLSVSSKKDNKSNLHKRKTLYNFDNLDEFAASTNAATTNNHDQSKIDFLKQPISSPARISMNRSKKIQLKNPQRIKSLKNVLDDLPTPSSSNNKLLDINEDRVKSDADINADDNLNENLKLSNQKISKSSTMANVIKSGLFLEEEEEKNEEKKPSTKPSKTKNLNKKSEEDSENEKTNNKTSKNKQNQKKQQQIKQQRKSSDQNSSDDENDLDAISKKRRKSSGNENKPTTTNKSTKQTKKNTNKNEENIKSSDNENDQDGITKKRRKSIDVKKQSKSQKPTRTYYIKSDGTQNSSDEETAEQNKTAKKTRKSNESKQTKPQKTVKKSSSNNQNSSDNENNEQETITTTTKKQRKSNESKKQTKSQKPTRTPLNLIDEDNENSSEEENKEQETTTTTKKQRKSNESKKQTKSQKISRAPLNKIDDDDDDNNENDEDDNENNSEEDVILKELAKRRRKSNEVKRTSKSQKPTRTPHNLINDDNENSSDEEIIENEKAKRHRKSADVKITTRSPKPKQKSSNTEENEDDENENERSKRHRRPSNHTKQQKSQKIIRKSSNENDESDEERNIRHRKSSSNDKMKQTRKSSNNDNDDDVEDRNQRHRKSNSKPTRKSSNNNDDDDIEIKNLRHRKSSSNERLKLQQKSSSNNNNNNNDDDDNDEIETNHHKPRRRSVQQSKSSQYFNVKEKSNKPQRKSNEDDNIRKKTKSYKATNPATKKSSNPILKNVPSSKQRSKSINKPAKKSDNDPNKKNIQIQFNSSSEYETYSSDSINPNLYYKDEEMDRSSESYDD